MDNRSYYYSGRRGGAGSFRGRGTFGSSRGMYYGHKKYGHPNELLASRVQDSRPKEQRPVLDEDMLEFDGSVSVKEQRFVHDEDLQESDKSAPDLTPKKFPLQPREDYLLAGAEPRLEVRKSLAVSLEEVYNGAVKHVKVGRRLMDGTTEHKILYVEIRRGCRSGTRIRFPNAGSEIAPGHIQDIVFITEEMPHDVFRRIGNGTNLLANMKIPLVEALAGPQCDDEVTKRVKVLNMLDGRKLEIPVPSGIIKPGCQTKIQGEGMPFWRDGAVRGAGDLIVKWFVEFPDSLKSSQRQGIKKILGPSPPVSGA